MQPAKYSTPKELANSYRVDVSKPCSLPGLQQPWADISKRLRRYEFLCKAIPMIQQDRCDWHLGIVAVNQKPCRSAFPPFTILSYSARARNRFVLDGSRWW